MTNDDIEWGPWIEHDGGKPIGPDGGKYPIGCTIETQQLPQGQKHSPHEMERGGRSGDSPAWFWSMRRKFWVFGEKVPVCHDPEYAPIIRYRWGKPRAKSAAVERMSQIASAPKMPLPAAPEGPKRERAQ